MLGNRQIEEEVARAGPFEPHFTLRCDERPAAIDFDIRDPTGRRSIRRGHEEAMRDDLRRLGARHSLGRGDFLVLNSLRHWALQAIIDWLEESHVEDRPQVAVILHYTAHPEPGIPDPCVEDYRAAFSRIAASPARRSLRLFTDSDGLAAEYARIFPANIPVVPIPHCPNHVEDASGETQKKGLAFAFAGEARMEKGFHHLPSVIRTVLAAPDGTGTRFMIQAVACTTEDLKAIRMVEAEAPDRIQLLSRPLDEAAYECFLQQADVVLIPYQRFCYHTQTSGIYAEAVSLGKPVVVPSGTWMAEQVARYGGGIIFEVNDEEDIARACLQMVDGYPALKAAAVAAGKDWVAFHNADVFLSIVSDALLITEPENG